MLSMACFLTGLFFIFWAFYACWKMADERRRAERKRLREKSWGKR